MSYKKLLSISNGFIQNLKKYGKIYSIMSRKIFIDDFLLARYDQKLYGCHHCLILVVLCTIISGFNVVDFRKEDCHSGLTKLQCFFHPKGNTPFFFMSPTSKRLSADKTKEQSQLKYAIKKGKKNTRPFLFYLSVTSWKALAASNPFEITFPTYY